MKKFYLSVIAVLAVGLLTLLPLANRPVRVLLNDAESRVNEEPARVLELLDSISYLQARWGRGLRARFALLYTRAQDKSLIDVDDDSLIVRAVDYYRTHGNHRSRAMAYYYYAVVHHNAGDIDGAMEALVKAQLEVEECDDSYLQGLIYSELGNAYFEQYTYVDASVMYKLALEKFQQCNLYENIFIAQYCCGLSLFFEGNYSESYTYLSSTLEYAKKSNNIDAILNIEMVLIHIKIKKSASIEEIEYLKQKLLSIYDFYTDGKIPVTHYPILGNIYAKTRDLDSARYFILEFLKQDHEIEFHNIGIWALLSSIESKYNNYQLAYNYEKNYSYYNDSINRCIRDYEVRALDRRYKNIELKDSYKKLLLKYRYERIGVMIFLGMLGIIVWLGIRYYQRKRIREREMFDISISEYQRYHAELEERHEALMKMCNENDQKLQGMLKVLKNRTLDLQRITEWASVHEKNPDTFYDRVKEYFQMSESKNKELVRDIQTIANIYYYGVIDYLRHICPALSPRELNYCSLVCLGFTPECIRILFNHTNIYSIYTIRNKVRDKLGLKRSSFNLEKHIYDLEDEAKVWTEKRRMICQ